MLPTIRIINNINFLHSNKLTINGSIHLWLINVNDCNNYYQYFSALLSSEEKERALKYPRERDKRLFIVCRGGLRWILSSYPSEEPNKVKLSANHYGKPSLISSAKETQISFNVSHSRAYIICAFILRGHIGVDMEYVYDFLEMDYISRLYFTQQELAEMINAPQCDKARSFFRACVRSVRGRETGVIFVDATVRLLPLTRNAGRKCREIWPISASHTGSYDMDTERSYLESPRGRLERPPNPCAYIGFGSVPDNEHR